ncbi:uncharacterized protein LOC135488594 [Lineus longissimus]|uniref:uncharacterized protein LOC135488594 n=1 Tax=Lineus longissimus TaxID=88925 RepID=UPI00315D1021
MSVAASSRGWFLLVVMNLLAIGIALCMLQTNRWDVKPCAFATKQPATPSRSVQKPHVLEFPRLFQAPLCDPSNNTSVPKGVCENLADTMDEIKYRQTYLRLLKYFDEMATKHKWTYFMTSGTLLGSWRHHDVIPWDLDMDLLVEYEDRIDIVDRIEEQERFVPKQCTHHKIRLHDRDNVERSYYWRGLGRYSIPSIDIFFFNRNRTHIQRSDYPEEYVFELHHIFPLHRRPLSNLMLLSPRDPISHLVTLYGATDECGGLGRQQKCDLYEPYVPFVHRRWFNGLMEESLVLNGTVLQVKQIDEMDISLPLSPYTLETKSSQTKAKD